MLEPGATFAELRDSDPLMFECEQARLLLKGAIVHLGNAMKLCDHKVIRTELDHAEAAIDLAEGRLGNAQGCQAKRIAEEDPEEW